jgi:hypothetical protein
MATTTTTTTNTESVMTLQEAAKHLGFTEAYVRVLIRKGRIRTRKVPLGPESQVWKHMLIAADVRGLTKRARGVARPDGRSKYVFYATEAEAELARRLFRGGGLEDIVEFLTSAKQEGIYKLRKAKMIRAQLNHDS